MLWIKNKLEILLPTAKVMLVIIAGAFVLCLVVGISLILNRESVFDLIGSLFGQGKDRMTVALSEVFTDTVSQYAKGLAFGFMFAASKVIMMNHTISRVVELPKQKAASYATKHYYVRYMLTGIVFVIAVLEPSISVAATVMGILSFNLSAYITQIYEKKFGMLRGEGNKMEMEKKY